MKKRRFMFQLEATKACRGFLFNETLLVALMHLILVVKKMKALASAVGKLISY